MSRTINAGPFEMLYRDGFLRRISCQEVEIVRMIYFALRDEHWGTLPLFIENEKIVTNHHSFHISYDASNVRDGRKIFEWHTSIEGNEDGSITFHVDGKALEDVWTNRAGFCLLHPLHGYKGTPCQIIHPDGTRERLSFPNLIADDNPFKEISEMRWSIRGHHLEVKFEGDVFETEDQRNWGDASFKTFCTPLSKPFPVLMKNGHGVNQTISIRLGGTAKLLTATRPEPTLEKMNERMPLPAIGIGMSTETAGLNNDNLKKISAAGFNHYKIELDLTKSDWKNLLSVQTRMANTMNLSIELCVMTSEDFIREISELQAVLGESSPLSILFLSAGAMVTKQEVVNHVESRRKTFGQTKIGFGTNYNFKEINSNRLDLSVADFVSLSIDPQEHAFDDMTILENTQAHADIVESTRKIYPRQAVHISPLLLKRRFNPYTKDPSALVIPDSLRTDIRQTQQLGAVYTLASIKNLISSACASVTCYQTAGLQGIMSSDGNCYPVYDALRLILKHKTAQLMKSSNPNEVDGLMLGEGDQREIILWNLSEETINVKVEGRVVALTSYQILVIPITTTN